jgi:hypothetical protein
MPDVAPHLHTRAVVNASARLLASHLVSR